MKVTDNPVRLAQNSCKYVERTPVYSKRIGNFTICPSEYGNEKGAYIMDSEEPCRLVADPGETYCPRSGSRNGENCND